VTTAPSGGQVHVDGAERASRGSREAFGIAGSTGTGRGEGGGGEGTTGLGTRPTIGHGSVAEMHGEEVRFAKRAPDVTDESRDEDRERLAGELSRGGVLRSLANANTGERLGGDIGGNIRDETAGVFRDENSEALDLERRRQRSIEIIRGITTTTTTVTTTTHWSPAHHRPRRCSEGAALPLADREALWRERLAAASGPSGWVEVYREARRKCEAPSFRERRALLRLMLARAGSIGQMIQLYRAMPSWGVRSFLRAAILRRVRTPADLTAVRGAFGVSASLDWSLVEQILSRARNEAHRIRLLRELVLQNPGNFELKLRLLAALEGADRGAEARRLAHALRQDPLSDAGVRTAVGEMYLRMGDEDEARRVFSEIVEFAPYDALARRRLGDLYRAHGWFEDAYRQYQTLAEIRPDDSAVLLLLAQAAAGAGRVDEALRLEQRLAETAEPGSARGLERVALLWSSVRLAKLRMAARGSGDEERLRALTARMRRSGVLREAGAMRISLTWSHPDAGLSLWVAHPGLGLTRPSDIAPEFGLEAFDLREAEAGRYRLEVRRTGRERDLRTPVEAELVLIWNEGRADEQIHIERLRFEGAAQRARAWSIEGRSLEDAEPSR
jgi:Ca-activated chloride channel family protein